MAEVDEKLARYRQGFIDDLKYARAADREKLVHYREWLTRCIRYGGEMAERALKKFDETFEDIRDAEGR